MPSQVSYNERRAVRVLDPLSGGCPAWNLFCDRCAAKLNPEGDAPVRAYRTIVPVGSVCCDCGRNV